MSLRPRLSRTRFEQYRRDAREHKTEGTRGTAAAAKAQGEQHRNFRQLFAAFWGLLRGNRKTVVIAIGTVTVATVLNLAPPYASKIVFDQVLGDVPMPPWLASLLGESISRGQLLTAVAIALVIISITTITLGTWGRWLATLTSNRLKSSIRRLVFSHAVRLPLHRVYELKSGGVTSILREDAGGVADLVFSLFYNPWRAIVRLAGSLIILAVIDWRLLLGSLLLLPVVYTTHKTWVARIRPLWRDIRATRQDVDSHATEAFGGMRIVRSFGRQRSETARFIRNNHLMIRKEFLAWWFSRGVDIAWGVLIPAASAILLWYGGRQVLAGNLSIGELVMFLMYLAWLLEPIATLASSATNFQNSLAGLDRILDLVAEPVEFADVSAGTIRLRPAEVAGAIAVRDVSFTYPGSSRPVLAGIDLDVKPGEIVALVGASGSGKTTLCNLIARFYDPDAGVVELDDRDLRDINVESYRRLLGIVEQDIFLFDGSVAQNIGYARPGASVEEIEHVARLAHAHEFITELDRGYETIIGERGVKLSGGQRQRIAIARALLADPRILILDEATSNLDTESERLIQAGLDTLMRDRTSFVIAHRLSTITHADQIVVLEKGRISERGTHEELMRRSGGSYQAMVALQLQEMGGSPPPAPVAPLAPEDERAERRLGIRP